VSRSRVLLAGFVAGLVVLLDQASKLWATEALRGHPPVEVIGNFFHFVYHRNTGGVFGLFSGSPSAVRVGFFIIVTLAALGFVVYLMKEWGRESRAALLALSLVAGGAVGNLIDRIAYGEVIDFIDWHWHTHHWPAFNIADSAITVGTVILILSVFLAREPARTSP
jgi:signal peptidase II